MQDNKPPYNDVLVFPHPGTEMEPSNDYSVSSPLLGLPTMVPLGTSSEVLQYREETTSFPVDEKMIRRCLQSSCHQPRLDFDIIYRCSKSAFQRACAA